MTVFHQDSWYGAQQECERPQICGPIAAYSSLIVTRSDHSNFIQSKEHFENDGPVPDIVAFFKDRRIDELPSFQRQSQASQYSRLNMIYAYRLWERFRSILSNRMF